MFFFVRSRPLYIHYPAGGRMMAAVEVISTLLIVAMFSVQPLSVSAQCHPTCAYECDSPTCFASCVPQCLPYRCQTCELNPFTNVTTCGPLSSSGCYVHCPRDQCEEDSCPECEIICNVGNLCNPDDPYCHVQCLELECDWKCDKPGDCPLPRCELQCDPPACAASSGSGGGGCQGYLREESWRYVGYTLYLLLLSRCY